MPRTTFGPISLSLPANWPLSIVILAGPPNPPQAESRLPIKAPRPFQRNVIATMERVPSTETPYSYIQRQIKGLREAGVEWEGERPPESVKLENVVDGAITEQVITSADGDRVRQMQLVCIKENVAHTIIASQLDGPPFESVREEFRSILLSFASEV